MTLTDKKHNNHIYQTLPSRHLLPVPVKKTLPLLLIPIATKELISLLTHVQIGQQLESLAHVSPHWL